MLGHDVYVISRRATEDRLKKDDNSEKELSDLQRKIDRELDSKKLEMLEQKEEMLRKLKRDIDREKEQEERQLKIDKETALKQVSVLNFQNVF